MRYGIQSILKRTDLIVAHGDWLKDTLTFVAKKNFSKFRVVNNPINVVIPADLTNEAR